MALLCQREGIEMVHVPFRGDADGTQALLGGHIDIMAGGSSLVTQVDGGQAEFMHVWTAERLRRWPQAPTLHDLGYGMTVTTPFGVVAPAGLDPAVRAALHDAFRRATREPAFQAVLERFDMPDEYRDGEAYAALLRDMVAEEHALIARLGLRGS
jgi:tripartite-type tricarboxylate transporter receptor subunit TctC